MQRKLQYSSPQRGKENSMNNVANTQLQTRFLVFAKNGSELKPVKIYFDQSGKKWIEARPNTPYVIEIKNDSYNRYLSVISVDGLNVISGNEAELTAENGYVLDPRSSLKVEGWRVNMNEVREFKFTNDISESYAEKLNGDSSNRGVIGIAFFQQKMYSSWLSTHTFNSYPTYTLNNSTARGLVPGTYTNTSSGPDITCSVNSVHSSKKYDAEVNLMHMATAQGETVDSQVSHSSVEFVPNVSCTDIIYYDSRENLIARGIIKENEARHPQPFKTTGFCPNL
jgi:hypothetical protein